MGTEADFDIVQAFTMGQLSKCHTGELFKMTELEHRIFTGIFGDAAAEYMHRQMVE